MSNKKQGGRKKPAPKKMDTAIKRVLDTVVDDTKPEKDTDDKFFEAELKPSGIKVGDEYFPHDPSVIINMDRPDENHPVHGWQPPGVNFRWCTDLQRCKTGMEHWRKVSRSKHPELVPVNHPLTSESDGAQDEIRINDAFLCVARTEDVKKRQDYFLKRDEKRLDRKLYESHKEAQRTSAGPGVSFKTGKVVHKPFREPVSTGRKKSMVSVPAQIK